MSAVAQFRCDEQLAPRHASRADCLPDPFLVAVAFGGVDRPVAGLDPPTHDLGRNGGIDLPHPKAELGNGGAVVEFDLFRHIQVLLCIGVIGVPPGA